MSYLFLFTIYTVIVYCIFRVVEMRFIDGEMKPLRELVREMIVVGSASLLAAYGYVYTHQYFGEFIHFITENKIVQMDAPQIFTDTPAF